MRSFSRASATPSNAPKLNTVALCPRPTAQCEIARIAHGRAPSDRPTTLEPRSSCRCDPKSCNGTSSAVLQLLRALLFTSSQRVGNTSIRWWDSHARSRSRRPRLVGDRCRRLRSISSAKGIETRSGAQRARRMSELTAVPRDSDDAATGTAPTTCSRTVRTVRAASMLVDLLPAADRGRRRSSVCDAAEFAGPIVAAAHGVPIVTPFLRSVVARTRVARQVNKCPSVVGAGTRAEPYGGFYDYLYLDIYRRAADRETSARPTRNTCARRPSPRGDESPPTGSPRLSRRRSCTSRSARSSATTKC